MNTNINSAKSLSEVLREPEMRYFSDHGGEIITGDGYRLLCRPMVIREAAWWQKRGIGHELLDWFEVKMVKRVEMDDFNGQPQTIHIADGDMAFALPWGDNCHRLIRLSSRFQPSIWLGQEPWPTCFGWSMLPRKGQVVYVVRDEFEVMRLFEKGIPAICLADPAAPMDADLQLELSRRFQMTFFVGDLGRRKFSA